jgi:hypothetical protein
MNELSLHEDQVAGIGFSACDECDYDCHTESDHGCYDD